MSKCISTPINRFDVKEKISGEAKYVSDINLENSLYAKTLRSTKARAKIVSIKYPTMPEGYFIVDKNDIAGKNRVKIMFYDMPFFAEDIVNYIGEPISLIVGEDKERILDIINKIEIEYEEMKPIFTIEESENSEEKIPIYKDDNCFANYSYEKGTIDSAYSSSYMVFSREYKTGYQEHIYLEPQGIAATYDEETHKVTVIGSMQCPYFVKNAVIEAMGLVEDKVQIIQSTTGGAFGGKEEYPSLIGGQVAAAAMKAKKPVILIFERDEDIECSTKGHPSKIKLTTLVDENNKIIGMDADIILNGGAYSGLSNIVLQRAMFTITGVYNIPNVRVRGKAVATNTVPNGGFRGFGTPQSIFALEMHIDYMANELGIDTLEFKKMNLLNQGDLSSTGGIFRGHVPLNDLIEKVEELSDYSKKVKEFKLDNNYRGIGLSLFFHGEGFTGSEERDHIKAVVKLKKYTDDTVEILISNVEMGQGVHTTLRKIVAEELDIPIETIIIINPDKDRVPNSGPTVASRTIVAIGKLLQEASKELKGKWESTKEAEVTTKYKFPEGFYWNDETFQGDAYNEYSWGANVVEVQVNPITYEVDVKEIYAVYDIGSAIDEKIIKGQIDGGIIQGLGHGSIEVMECRNGQLIQRTNTDYVIPTALDFPNIKSELINNLYDNGSLGAESAGELTFVGAPVAYALAVKNAIGKDINKIPVNPEYLMEVMDSE